MVIMLFGGGLAPALAVAGPDAAYAQPNFPKPLEDYHDDQMPGLVQKLVNRVLAEPFNIVGTLIFFCAILHTFLTAKFMHIAHACQHEFGKDGISPGGLVLGAIVPTIILPSTI